MRYRLELPERIELEVKPSHIRRGCRASEKDCPTALALGGYCGRHRIFYHLWYVYSGDDVVVSQGEIDGKAQVTQYSGASPEDIQRLDDFIQTYDKFGPRAVEPIRVTLARMGELGELEWP